jgi:dTDP-4-amino-4,6-dideoxy-D-galactose acyltransferase
VSPPCELLPWDSEFFGRRVARVCGDRPSAADWQAVRVWCHEQRVDCLYFLCPADCPAATAQAQEAGCRLVDVRVTLGRPPGTLPGPAGCGVRAGRPEDLDELLPVARVAHTDSRFFQDGHFPCRQAEELFAVWLRRSWEGWAQQVLVAEVEGRPAGYLTCHLEDSRGRIGLVGVAPEFQGRGLGRGLLKAGLEWFTFRGAGEVTVVTQGRNVRAQRLYQRCGFVTVDVHLWFHRWFPRADQAGQRQ